MQYTINELKKKIFKGVYDVYEIFQNFFESRFVDLQELPSEEELQIYLTILEFEHHTDETTGEEKWGDISPERINSLRRHYSNQKAVILVWWPHVTITNENNRSIDIQDLYAKVEVTLDGRIPYEYRGFQLNRTTFNELQYSNGYMHSHCQRFSVIPHFSDPCLGTGPINNTIMDLKNGYEETLWMLFCQELSLYVTVESLRGVPYIKMESLSSRTQMYNHQGFTNGCNRLNQIRRVFRSDEEYEELKTMLKEFTLWYLENGHLTLNYVNNEFIQGSSYYDFIVDMSSCFIKFYNDRCHPDVNKTNWFFSLNIVEKAIASDGKFYRTGSTSSPDNNSIVNEGRGILIFKGEQKHLHIERRPHEEEQVSLLLNHDIAMYILHNVLQIINYRYRNEYNRKRGNENTVTPAYQNVCYI